MASDGILAGEEFGRFQKMGLMIGKTYWGHLAGAQAQAEARALGGVVVAVRNTQGVLVYLIVARKDWATIWNGGKGDSAGGVTVPGSGVDVMPSTPAGLTNPGSQQSGSSVASGGGADIPRGATGPQGVGTDIRSEFLGISTFAPDTMLGGQYAAYAENVDGIAARGALSKRPGYVPVYPNRFYQDDPDTPTLPAITDGHGGRSINVLPGGVRHQGRAILVLGYDDSSALGDGTSDTDTTELRAVAVDANYNVQRDISRVKPIVVSDGVSTPGDIRFVVEMPPEYRRDLMDDDGVQASVTQLVIVASKKGYFLDRDNEDDKGRGRMVADYTAWDGNNRTIADNNLVEGETWYYTVWAVNKFEVSLPAFYKETVEVTP